MPEVLQITRKKRDAIDVLCLSGRLDTNTAAEADAALRELVAAGSSRIVLNFKGLGYISSSGLRILISVLREVKKRQGDVKLACLEPAVKEILHMAGFDRLFLIYETEEEAVSGFGYVALDDKERRVLDAVVTTLDIDEDRRRTEESLLQTKNLYRAIFENSGTAMAIVEDDFTICLANTEFEKMAGCTRKELVEVASLLSFIARDDLAMATEFHDLVRRDTDNQPKHYEIRFRDRKGDIIYVYVVVDMIPGTPRRVYSLLDITDLRKIEEDLRCELMRKREFIILAAHELRTPLQPVLGFLNLVLEDPDSYGLNADGLVLLHKCSDNVDLMRGIVDNIIRLGGRGYGPEQLLPRFKPRYREISPRQLLDSYIPLLKFSGGITFDVRIPSDLKISTDSEYFYLIVQSLMYTVIRYSTPPAEIEISHRYDKTSNYFSVRNSAAVIAEEIIPDLFTPRSVRDSPDSPDESGFIGLSLPVAKQISEKMNGDITVTSSPGSGTGFTLVLPRSLLPD